MRVYKKDVILYMLKKSESQSHPYKFIQDLKMLKSKCVQYHHESEIFGPYDDT